MKEQTLLSTLKTLRRNRQIRRLVLLMGGATLFYGGSLLLLAGLDQFFLFTEWAAFLSRSVLSIAALAFLVLGLLYILLTRPRDSVLASEWEKKHPEWKNSLVTAVEQEKLAPEERTPIGEALIRRMRTKVEGLNPLETIPARRLQNNVLIPLLAVGLLLTWISGLTDFAYRASAFQEDLRAGQNTGLMVEPGNRDVPKGEDQRITATILRGPEEATIEYQVEGQRERQEYTMHPSREGAPHFTFYDLRESVRYRVKTPTQRSPWYQLETFIPPSIDEIDLQVSPPLYTQVESESFRELRNLRIPEGSTIDLAIQLENGAGFDLVLDDGEEITRKTAEAGDKETLFELSFRPDRSGTWYLELYDEEDRRLQTRTFSLDRTPDNPPTIEVLRPGEDREAKPEEDIVFAASASDDYGLTAITMHLSVSGFVQENLPLFRDSFPSEEEIADGADIPLLETDRSVRIEISPEALEAQDGDVITYYFTATDNRQPEPQTSRSEVFFIEVRDELEAQEAEEGMDFDEEDLFDVRALIVEMKRLIRVSFRSMDRSTAEQEEALQDLTRSIEELRIETSQMRQKAVDMAGGVEEGIHIIDLFSGAVHHMRAAGDFLEQALIRESLPDQEQALAHLVRIETEMTEQMMESEEGEGEGESEADPSEEAEDGEGEGEGEEDSRQLQELLQRTQRLADDQGAQNTRARRSADREIDDDRRRELSRQQDELSSEANAIARALSELRGTDRATSAVVAARRTMENALRNIGEDRLRSAQREGERARASLLEAIDELEALLQDSAAAEVEAMADRAREMAENQRGVGEGSRDLEEQGAESEQDPGELQDQQDGLRDDFGDLLRELEDMAQGLRENFPEAADELGETGREMRESGIDGDMGRSSNALLFERFDRAGELSDEIAELLEQFGGQMGDTASRLPQITPERLQRALEQVQEGEEQIGELFGEDPDEAGEQGREITGRIGQSLGRIGELSGNERLEELAQSLLEEAERDPNLIRSQELLETSARELERQIIALELDRRARLGRMASPPPERYRDLVEEYFRSLSESE
ncbi:MAG: DUF4175 family protein [Opitutales bacterium]|nr:DUF4175 family protein [Opitutales bacterium]